MGRCTKGDPSRVTEEIDAQGDVDPARGKAVLAVFDWSQKAAEIWRGSNTMARRQILDSVCLNRQVSDVTLVTTKRKPFAFVKIRVPKMLFGIRYCGNGAVTVRGGSGHAHILR